MNYKSVFLSFLSLSLGLSLGAQQVSSWNLSPVDVLNTPGDEYAPRVGVNGLLYSRSPTTGELNEGLRTELMFSPFRENGLHEGRVFSEELSSPLHESSASLGPNEDFVVFSRNSPSKRKATNYLYLSRTGVLDFQEAEQLPFNDPRFNTTHPTLDVSGKRLLFASDRPGGFGGFDLYYAEFKDGFWSKPINLGKEVNSKSDEIFPYWSDNNQITFSSNRAGGYGGLDLYLLDASQSEWKKVKHLGKPFSSEGDDHGLSWSSAKGQGFLASNRIGGKGGDDIYSFSFSEEYPIAWLASGPAKDKLVILNATGDVVAKLNELNIWKGTLSAYPNPDRLNHKALAQRLCGSFVDGGTQTPDSIRMQGFRVEIARADLSQPLTGVVLRNPKQAEDAISYRSDYTGGVCVPSLTEEQSWILEKQGFVPRSVRLDPARPFIKADLELNYPADTIVLRNTIVSNRRISSSLSDKLVSEVSRIGIEPKYELISMRLNLLSTQSPKSARVEAERLVRAVRKELLLHSSASVESTGKSVFSDEGVREQARINIKAEAVLEYEMIFRRIPTVKGIGLQVD